MSGHYSEYLAARAALKKFVNPVAFGGFLSPFEPESDSYEVSPRSTSQKAYESILNNKLFTKRTLQVFELFREFGPLTINEVIRIGQSRSHGASASSFGSRVSELHQCEVLKLVGSKVDIITNRKCCVWELSGKLPVARTENKDSARVQLLRQEIKRLYKHIDGCCGCRGI